MIEHVTIWLEAYHDGELKGRRLEQVEAHLAVCAACRAELEKLQALTAMLQTNPPASNLMPPERFVAQVGLRLARRPVAPAWQRTLEAGWRLVPVGLLGAWAFVQTMFIVAGAVVWASKLGFGGNLISRLAPAPQGEFLLNELSRFSTLDLDVVGEMALRTLRGGSLWRGDIVWQLALSVAIGLLYLSWLASWWVRRQRNRPQAV